MITDPIADLFTRIRNGYLARLQEISAPYSKINERIVAILVKNRYVAGFRIETEGVLKTLKVALNDVRKTKYVPTLARISKPGRRVYVGVSEIKKSRNGLGIFILSTPKGVITGYEAHALNVGGEMIGEIY